MFLVQSVQTRAAGSVTPSVTSPQDSLMASSCVSNLCSSLELGDQF